jgi:hypothetical protein
MPFDPAARLFQDLVRRLASEQVAVRDANFPSKIGALDMHVRGFSSWKNIRSLKLPNRLISGIRAPAIAPELGQYLP